MEVIAARLHIARCEYVAVLVRVAVVVVGRKYALYLRILGVISPRTIDTPVYDNSWAKFDDEVHDFADMFGLPEDWSEYVSLAAVGGQCGLSNGRLVNAVQWHHESIVLYCWEDGTTDDVELTVKISKAQLPSQWTSGAGLPTISVPESLSVSPLLPPVE